MLLVLLTTTAGCTTDGKRPRHQQSWAATYAVDTCPATTLWQQASRECAAFLSEACTTADAAYLSAAGSKRTAGNVTDGTSSIMQQEGRAGSASSSRDTYIVRFRNYKSLADHRTSLHQVGTAALLLDMQFVLGKSWCIGTAVRLCTKSLETLSIQCKGLGSSDSVALVLPQVLGHLRQHWTWLDRHNKAQNYPSDFALLSISRPSLGKLQQALQQASGYKDMHPDRRIRGLKNWQPEEQLAAAFSDNSAQPQQLLHQQGAHLRLQQGPADNQHSAYEIADSSRQLLGEEDKPGFSGDDAKPAAPAAPSPELQQQQQQQAPNDNDQAESIWTTSKPPGRFTTRPTIGLDPNNPADRAASQGKDELRKRRSLLSWSQGVLAALGTKRRGRRLTDTSDTRVTTLLEAKKLWDQGYSGKGIKVNWSSCIGTRNGMKPLQQ